MNKKLLFDLLYVFLIVAVILFMIFVTFYMLDNKRECLSNPIGWFESKNDATCFCMKDGIFFERQNDKLIYIENG